MRNGILYTMVAAAALTAAASCVKEAMEGDVASGRISLYASIPLQVQTAPAGKGSPEGDGGVLDSSYPEELEIALARVDQGYLSYPDFVNCSGPLTATMGIPDQSSSYMREINFDRAQFFSGTDTEISFAAWYPWPAEDDGSLPEGYSYISDSQATEVSIPIDGSTDIMYSTVAKGTQSTGFNVLEFNHALCVYRIYVYAMVYTDDTGNEESTADLWGSLESMAIPDMPASCTITLPRTSAASGQDPVYLHELAYSSETVTLDLSDPEDKDIFFDPGDALPVGLANRRHVATFISAPPSDGIMDINLTTSNSTAKQEVSIAKNFQAGYAYDIFLRFSDHGIINAEVSVADWQKGEDVEQPVDASIYYDLSTYGTSNCYHISSANYGYCFDGTVKGNGNGASVGITDASLDPAYVDILWADIPEIEYNGEKICPVVMASNTLVKGKVMFKVLGDSSDQNNTELQSEGNVLLAAYDKVPERDSDGNITNGANIIWTWHLWLSDPVQKHGYSNGFIVQDRNLGAVDAAPEGDCKNIWGMLYQWGRPTPFRFSVKPDSQDNRATMDEAVSHPDVLYGGYNGEWDQFWLSDPVLDSYIAGLWGYTSDYEDPVKTIYDPCPQGYRVYEERMWNSLHMYQRRIEGEYVYLRINDDIYYPFQDTYLADATHVEHGAEANDANKGAFLWSGTIDTGIDPPTPYRLWYLFSKEEAEAVSYDSRRNSAMPVRCVSEHSEMVVTDLSAAQTANCYMVHKEGYYKFKANVRGNGVGRLLPLGGTEMAEINAGMSTSISPDKVDMLWWQGDFTEVSAVSPDDPGGESDVENYLHVSFLDGGRPDADGYVTFHVEEFHKGNLILAAYDPDGVILWTWHIWMTDEPQLKASGVYVLMDRFLGATYAPDLSKQIIFDSAEKVLATYGFYYQWGRKDPIPGPPSWNTGNRNNSDSSVWWSKAFGSTGWTRHTYVETSPAVTIPESVRDPMKFYYSSNSKAGSTTSNWFDSSFDDGYTNVALWGYAVKDYGLGESFSKTMYDPCPPGYMTPEYKIWYNDENSNRYSDQGSGHKYLNNGEDNYSSRDYGYGMVTTLVDFDLNWYPSSGCRSPQSGHLENVSYEGYMWTSTPMGAHNARSLYHNVRRNNGSISGQTADPDENGTETALGYPVRCMKE